MRQPKDGLLRCRLPACILCCTLEGGDGGLVRAVLRRPDMADRAMDSMSIMLRPATLAACGALGAEGAWLVDQEAYAQPP